MSPCPLQIKATVDINLRGVAEAHVRLRSHLRDTGGPEADCTLGSLKDIGYWFMEHLNDKASSFPEGWLPAWWGDTPTADSSKDATCPLTRQQLNLIDEVHVLRRRGATKSSRG